MISSSASVVGIGSTCTVPTLPSTSLQVSVEARRTCRRTTSHLQLFFNHTHSVNVMQFQQQQCLQYFPDNWHHGIIIAAGFCWSCQQHVQLQTIENSLTCITVAFSQDDADFQIYKTIYPLWSVNYGPFISFPFLSFQNFMGFFCFSIFLWFGKCGHLPVFDLHVD